MAWTKVEFSDEEINSAGRLLADSDRFGAAPWDERHRAYTIVNNFRSAHSYPLNTFQLNLRREARKVDGQSIVAQRIKRLPSTIDKLRRYPDMKLTQMQDIGGCRAIVSSVPRVREMYTYYKQTSRVKHKLVSEKDYITEPKDSGYRSIHLVYRYYSDKHRTHNGLKVELQLRSRPQHYWAAAVETVGTMLRQALKSSAGEAKWLRFFALVGSAFAVRERTPTVPGTPAANGDLLKELTETATALDVRVRLTAYGSALRTMEDVGTRQGAHYFLVEVDPAQDRTDITAFARGDIEKATERYLEVEQALPSAGAEAVLVSVDSLDALRAAYPSYFLDSQNFLRLLDEVLGKTAPAKSNGSRPGRGGVPTPEVRETREVASGATDTPAN